MKLLSVAVPCYNMERYLAGCLDSLNRPELQEQLEVLVINDGSKDGSLEIARRYEASMPRIFRVIDQPNSGHGGAVNAAMAAASGKYFRIVDADDWVDGQQLTDFVRALAGTEADLVVDQRTEESQKSGLATPIPLPEGTVFARVDAFDPQRAVAIIPYLKLHTLTVRTELIQKFGVRLREHTFYVDAEFILKTTSRARSILFLDHWVYHYRVDNDDQSVSDRNFVRLYDHHDRVVRECLRFLEEGEWDAPRRVFCERSLALLVNTQLNIALIYNADRKQGMRQALELMKLLRRRAFSVYRKSWPHYACARCLHFLKIDGEGLRRIKSGRIGKGKGHERAI